MASPSTPVRSHAGSSFSTPSTVEHGTPPQNLTPRSKVKAMLAAIDDEGSSSESPKSLTASSRNPLSAVAGNTQRSREWQETGLDTASGLDVAGEEEEDDEEESLFIPRGRLAARLKSRPEIREDSSESRERSGDENAYARIKKRLILEKSVVEDRSSLIKKQDALRRTDSTNRDRSSSRRSPSNDISFHAQSSRSGLFRSHRSSPGLFVTPEGTPNSKADRQNSVEEPDAHSRVLDLVNRKKEELKAKQLAEDHKRKEKLARQQAFERDLASDASSASDVSDIDKATDRKLTQQARPTRKASKKALEEMNRETQRLSRNMQLAHQAKTKKRITKDSLFARFNFRTSVVPNGGNPHETQPLSSSTVVSSAPASDLEEVQGEQSPPTSPMRPFDDCTSNGFHGIEKHTASTTVEATISSCEDELPRVAEFMIKPTPKLDKGKGKLVEFSNMEKTQDSKVSRKPMFTQRPIRIRPPKHSVQFGSIDLDSDSELEVFSSKKTRSSKRDVFDRLPATKAEEGRSLRTLRALAHLSSPGKQVLGKKATVSLADMQTALQKRARQQAVEERMAKIEDLKSRGIIVQTAEERQEDQAEVENMIEKARREGEEILQKEKRAAKKAKIANGDVDDLPDTSDEDEDYRENHTNESHVELSGSEEVEEEEDGEDDALEGFLNSAFDLENPGNGEGDDEEEGGVSLDNDISEKYSLVVDEASEEGDDEHDDAETEDGQDEDDIGEPLLQRSRRNKMVIDDDEEEEGLKETVQTSIQDDSPVSQVPVFPAGLSNFGAEPMGMTQAFAATMANSQTQPLNDDEEQDSLALLDTVPEPDFPMFDTNDSLDLIEDSQLGQKEIDTNPSNGIELHFSQSQIRYDVLEDSQGQVNASQMSEIPDPTQDVGFIMSSPAPERRFVSEPPSTVDTVLLPGVIDQNSTVKKKRGRLQRRSIIEENLSDVEKDSTDTESKNGSIDAQINAFDAMRKARKAAKAAAAKDAFDKKKSEAKGMVEEQAQESEDEYAGLGGASDEDSGEEDEDVNAMMDHGEVNVNERQLAQLYA